MQDPSLVQPNPSIQARLAYPLSNVTWYCLVRKSSHKYAGLVHFTK